MILVSGATGLLGGAITRNLLAAGKDVRILVRQNSPAAEMAKSGMATDPQTLIETGAQPVYGDLKDRASLDRACEGVQTVLTTANSVGRDFDIEGVDLNGTRNLIDAARSAGVRHFVYTSLYGSHVDNPNPFVRCKAICEGYLKDSGMAYTILAPGYFMEIWIGMVVGMPLRAGQPVTLAGRGDHKHSFVAIQDVAAFGAAVVDNPIALNQVIPIGGPASQTWSEVVQAVGAAIGQDLPVNYVNLDQPVPLLPDGVQDMLKAMENYESFIDMSQTAAQYGVELTSLEAFAQRFFTQPPS
jgi:NADH dehydrogenase